MLVPIDDAVNLICKHAAEAVHYYNKISGMPPLADMPEYFMPAFLATRLATQFTITLETNLTKLFDWDVQNRETKPSQPMADLRDAYTKIGSPQVDFVLFASDENAKNEQGFLALVEFKLRQLSLEDREKLLGRLRGHQDQFRPPSRNGRCRIRKRPWLLMISDVGF